MEVNNYVRIISQIFKLLLFLLNLSNINIFLVVIFLLMFQTLAKKSNLFNHSSLCHHTHFTNFCGNLLHPVKVGKVVHYIYTVHLFSYNIFNSQIQIVRFISNF